MTTSLQNAFNEAAKLSPQEQDFLAEIVFEELRRENEFDQKIQTTCHQLDYLAQEALAEDAAGLTQELDPERL